jgi:hypothetical protein
MANQEEDLLHALALMANQYLDRGNELAHDFMTAGEHALRVLGEHGLVNYNGATATWTAKGLALLERRTFT